jgi:hypothetical protein
VGPGWNPVLSGLKTLLETGKPPDPDGVALRGSTDTEHPPFIRAGPCKGRVEGCPQANRVSRLLQRHAHQRKLASKPAGGGARIAEGARALRPPRVLGVGRGVCSWCLPCPFRSAVKTRVASDQGAGQRGRGPHHHVVREHRRIGTRSTDRGAG